MSEAPPINTTWQTARIIEVHRQTERIKTFRLALAQPVAFQAGQHVDVRLTAPNGYRAMRSYSIASAPDGSATLEIAVELLPNGEVSPFFHEVVAVGDEIELRGPLGGHFVWTPAEGGPLLLLGGGSGVVPLMAMARQRQRAAPEVATALLLSARRWDEVPFRDDLLGMDGRRDGFALVLTLTRDPSRRPGDFERRVDAAMIGRTVERLPGPPRHVFACGSNAFVSAAVDGALAAGVLPATIRTERYGV